MNMEAVKRLGPLAAARKSSLYTQGEMAELLGCSTNVLLNAEKEPESATIDMIKKIYQYVGQDGKAILDGFFFGLNK